MGSEVETESMRITTTATPLLVKKKPCYYEGCPGCMQDEKNELNEGIPYKIFFNVWLITLCSALPISSLIPFLYFMIQDMHVAKSDDNIGVYTGYIDAAFMFGRAATAVLWGIVADRYGRKPVIAVGLVSVIVFNTLFGLSTNIWMAIVTRLFLGLFSSLMGTMKAYASEVSRKEHQALGISVVNTSWATGLIIGSAIGGHLAKPAEKYPQIFLKNSFFGWFPYFLPCFCVSMVAVVAFLSYWSLPETLHMHNGIKMNDGTFEGLEESLDKDSSVKTTDKEENPLYKNWTFMSTIVAYCIFSLQDAAYTEIFSLWAVSSKNNGGLSFKSTDVGSVLSISGFGLLIYQLFLYPPIVKWIGTIMSTRIALGISIPLLASYPLMSKLSGLILTCVVNYASMMKNISSATISTGFVIFLNNAVFQDQRGAANGVAVTSMSLFKSLGPAAAGTIFSWAQGRQDASFLPGDLMVFFALNAVGLVVFLMTFKPFLTQPSKKDTNATKNKLLA